MQRGAVPEQPIDELKNGLQADRLSAGGFRANGFRLLLHMVAYALVVLFREAAAAIPVPISQFPSRSDPGRGARPSHPISSAPRCRHSRRP